MQVRLLMFWLLFLGFWWNLSYCLQEVLFRGPKALIHWPIWVANGIFGFKSSPNNVRYCSWCDVINFSKCLTSSSEIDRAVTKLIISYRVQYSYHTGSSLGTKSPIMIPKYVIKKDIWALVSIIWPSFKCLGFMLITWFPRSTFSLSKVFNL